MNPRIISAVMTAGLVLVGISGLGMPTAEAVPPSPGINNKVNFQGRLLNAAGAVIPDGNYNMQFKIYKNGDGLVANNSQCLTLPDCQSTAGTLLWTEEWLNQASNGVVVKNGYFSVNLGSVTTLVGVDLNQPVLWLSTNVAGGANATASCTPFSSCTPDGEMLPMKRIGSAVYAVNAGSAATCTTCVLQAPTSTAQNTIAPTVNSVVGLTVNGTSGTAATAVNIVQAGNAANLALSNTGSTSGNFLSVTHSTSAFTGTALLVNVASGSGSFASGNFMDLQANGVSKFRIDNLGALTLAGGQTADITTLAGTAPAALVFQPGNNTTATSTGASMTLQAGNDSGATASTGGLLTLKGGNATGGSQTGGGVTIDSGSGTTGGAINIGTTAAGSVNIGRTSRTTTNNGALTVSEALSATTTLTVTGLTALNGGVNVAKTLTVNSGATQNVQSITFSSPADSSGTNVSQGLNITTGALGNATAGTNTANIINLGPVTGDAQVTLNGINIGALTASAATETALNIGAGWDNVLSVNGTAILNATGVIQNAAVSGSYTGITGVGTVTAGTWQGTPVAAAYGGTGQSTYAIGDLLYASGAAALSKLAAVASGSCLISQGVATAPVWGACGGAGSTLQATYAASTGGTTSEIILDTTRGAVDIQDRSTTTIGANLFNVRASAVNDSTAGSLLFGVGNTGLATLQPSASLTNGQIALTQTATFANATGSGVVRGFQQNITVGSSTAATNKGLEVNVVDNSTTTAHTNKGLEVVMSGSNTSQVQFGVDASATRGTGVRGVSTNGSGTSTVGISTTGVGVIGSNTAAGAATNSYYGLQGVASVTGIAAYSAVGVFGSANAGSSSSVYGGYFTLASGMTALNAGSAVLQVENVTPGVSGSNGTNAVASLRVQGGQGGATTSTTGGTAGVGADVSITSGGGGLATGVSGANTGGAAGGVNLTGGVGGAVSSGSATGGVGGGVTLRGGTGGASTGAGINGNGGAVTLQGGAAGTGGVGGTPGGVIVRNLGDSAGAFAVQTAAGNNILSVDSSGNQTILGKAGTGGINGKLAFNTTHASNFVTTLTVSASQAANIDYTLPTALASTGQCLQAGTVAGSSVPLTFGSCGGAGGLAKNAMDTSAASVTSSNFLYAFTNSNTATTSGVLSLTNGTNTNSTLSVTASGNPASGQALIFGSNTNASPSGNLIDLQAGSSPTSRFKVSAAGQLGLNMGTAAPTSDIAFGNAANRVIEVQASTGATAGRNLTLTAGGSDVNATGGSSILQGGDTYGATFTAKGSLTTTNDDTGGDAEIQGGKTGALLRVSGNFYDAISGNENGGNILLQAAGGVAAGTHGVVTVKNGGNSATAFTVQNTSSQALLTVDTSAGRTLFGRVGTGGVNGAIVLNTTNASNFTSTLTVSASQAANISYTLPTALASTGQCLQAGTVAAPNVPLTFGSCGGGTTPDLDQVYAQSITNTNLTMEIDDAGGLLFNMTAGNFLIQDSGTTIATFNGTTGGITLAPASTGDLLVSTDADSNLQVTATAVPGVDMMAISNAGLGVTAAGVSGLSIDYVGGAAAVEASGARVNLTPGTTSGGTWSGLRIVAGATGAVAGVTEYGIKLEGPTSPGSGAETGVYVGTGWDIGMDVQSGGVQLAAQTDPATPAANNLRIYAKDIAGRIMPKWVGPAGVDTPFQASLGFNRVAMVQPGSFVTSCTTAGVFTGFGAGLISNAGTCASPTPASTNILTQTRRLTLSTGATAGTAAYHRQPMLQAWRGNAADTGGFFFTTRFGTSTLQAGNRAFVGMADSVANPTNVDPTTNTTPGKIGMAINANTGNWNIVNNVTGTAPTSTTLGANFPVSTTTLYELVIYSPPNGSAINYRVTNLGTGNQASGSWSTNIPTNTTFLAPLFWINNNATGAAAILDFGGWYLESDN